MRFILIFVLAMSCAACSTVHHRPVVQSATPQERAALLDRVKSLAGTWEGTAPDGSTGVTTYDITSSGSAVREVMLVGTEHEMTNMYTMDGPELLMTHYCAVGNQPHMRAAAAPGSSNDNHIAFKSADVSNLTAPDQMYMGEMTIEFIDADHIRQHWQSLQSGKPAEHSMTIELTRRK